MTTSTDPTQYNTLIEIMRNRMTVRAFDPSHVIPTSTTS